MSNGKVAIIKNIHIIYSCVPPKLNASSRANCRALVNVKIVNIHIIDSIYNIGNMGGIGKLLASDPPKGGNCFM